MFASLPLLALSHVSLPKQNPQIRQLKPYKEQAATHPQPQIGGTSSHPIQLVGAASSFFSSNPSSNRRCFNSSCTNRRRFFSAILNRRNHPQSSDLKSALEKKRKEGKSAPPLPLTTIQRVHISRLVEKYGDNYEEDGDRELLDDSEFYTQLLKEFLETNDPKSSDFYALKRLQTKKRKIVDWRASKSRKIWYNVHEKIVNFMAPQTMDLPPMAPKLFENLFGLKIQRPASIF